MIVSDRWKFLIATPTKSGNHSLRGAAESWLTHGGAESELRYYRPVVPNHSIGFQHQMAVPVGREHYDRWLMVRDPRSRLASCFEHMRHNRTEWGHWETLGGFLPFLEWFARERDRLGPGFPSARLISAQSPYKFVESYAVLYCILAGRIPEAAARWGTRPCGRLRLEGITEELARVALVANRRWEEEHGSPPPQAFRFPALPHRNATQPQNRWRGCSTWRDYFLADKGIAELGSRLCAADLAFLGASEDEPDGAGLSRSLTSR